MRRGDGTLLLLAGAGVGLYLFMRGRSGAQPVAALPAPSLPIRIPQTSSALIPQAPRIGRKLTDLFANLFPKDPPLPVPMATVDMTAPGFKVDAPWDPFMDATYEFC